jgi:hypothetical protein
MNPGIRPNFSKAVVILMLFFVCLPCSIKREIKQVLNISVADLSDAPKPNESAICEVFTGAIAQKNAVSNQKKQQQAYHHHSFSPFQLSTDQYSSSVSENEVFIQPPIYILHEQYLI